MLHVTIRLLGNTVDATQILLDYHVCSDLQKVDVLIEFLSDK